MIYLELFWSFLKIGFTSFGGLSMIPLISSEMISHGWMTLTEVSDIVAIAEMTPGPTGLNCATFAGLRTAGFLGAVVANTGVLFPSFTLALLAAVFFEKFKSSKLMGRILVGVRPASIGLIFGMSLTLCLSNYVERGTVSYAAVGIGLLDVFLLQKVRLSIPLTILVSAAFGILFFGVLGF